MLKYAMPGLLLLLTACTRSSSTFVCMTAFGALTFDSNDQKVYINSETITLKQADQALVINRSVCVEIISP